MITAKEARKIAEQNKQMTERLYTILEQISLASHIGKTFTEYDDSRDGGYLTTKEITFLRKLGYKVSKGKWEQFEGSHGYWHSLYKKVKISWDK